MKHKKKENSSIKIIIFLIVLSIVLSSVLVFLLVNKTNHGKNTEKINSSEKNVAVFETNLGTFKVKLFPEKAPKTVANFKKYVNEGFYNGLIFHRVIKGFMIQGGGFYPNLTKKVTMKPIPLESNNGLKNTIGTISMARTNNPNSATSQFFINVANNSFLDHSSSNPGYAVFGKVIDGMNVVNSISSVKTTSVNGYQNVPIKPIIIKKIYLE